MLFCLWMLCFSNPLVAPHTQLVTASADTSALLRLSVDQGEAVLLHADGKEARFDLDLGADPLIIERQTPGGVKRVPIYQLFGAHAGKLYLYHVAKKRLCVFDLASGKQQALHEGGFPVSPKQFVWSGDRLILLATLILESYCDGELFCSYFHELNPDTWASERHAGAGKSFQDSFMKADISVSFWLPGQKRGGIYYTKSHDLHWVAFDEDEAIQETQFADAAPKGKLRFSWFADALHVIGEDEGAVAVYRLKGNHWRRMQRWYGKWSAFSLLGSRVILIDEAGNIQRHQLIEGS